MIILIKKKSANDSIYSELYGSIYNEFKNDKGLISSIFYVLFFIRRLLFALSQLLLSNLPILQIISHIIFSILQFLYVLYYRPFKDKIALTCEIFGEICVFITFILSFTIIFISNHDAVEKIENSIQWNIIIGIFIQLVMCGYSLAKSMLESYKSFKNKSSKNNNVSETTQVVPCDIKIDNLSIHSASMSVKSCKSNMIENE